MKKFFSLFVLAAAVLSFHALRAEDDTEPAHECTSWMVFSNLTKNNTNILHKNRDSKIRNIAAYMSAPGTKRKWIAIGNASTNSGVNSSGLAGAMNSGEKTPDEPNPKGQGRKGTVELLEIILNSCDTAAQAVAKLKEMVVDKKDYYHGDHGSTFFFLDTKEGYICEFTPKYFTVQRCEKDYALRANIWQNPGMQSRARGTFLTYLHSSTRAYTVLSSLNNALDTNGKITVKDIIALSRNNTLPKGAEKKYLVCNKRTNSGNTMEIDIQYPDVLSSCYFTLGYPRHTICLPMPVCVEKILPSMQTYIWSKAAFARFDKLGTDVEIPAEWLKFEADAMKKYAAAKVQARKLLALGKRTEAIKLLNTTAYGIWTQAEALLKPAAATTVTK